MFPLAGLALSLVPTLGKMIFGEDGGKIADSVVDVAKSVFGTEDKDEIEKAISTDPNLAIQFKMKLLDIQAQAQEQLHQRMLSEIADTDKARQTWSQNKSVIVLGFTIVVLVSMMNAMAVYLAFDMIFNADSITVLNGKDPGMIAAVFTFVGNVMGGFQAMGLQVVGFFFGSSKGGEDMARSISTAFSKLGSR